ncbi:E3 ubiquitin-protein ligase SINA-like 11 [Miscanthus floridulus]|uniref:E3 ubiquitin-protein ligase SINA-like 11 n=1 Tax=Miscanthus floridulus TaxID=154761 RepID=UPI003459E418
MASSSSPAPRLTVADEDVLECGVCFLPLKPPFFQCARGPCAVLAVRRQAQGCRQVPHVRRRHARRLPTLPRHGARGALRPQPYGCEARPVYHALQEHVLACAHAPCHCPASEAACGFKGSIPALLDHIVSAHGWPCTTARYGAPSSNVHLSDGFNFFVSYDDVVDEHGRRYLYLFNVVRHAFCRAVSVIRICPRIRAAKGVKLVLSYHLVNEQLFSHEQKIEFKVACSDLSDGLPDPHKSYQLTVSNYVLRDDDDNMILPSS